jgi:hypothetical protein
MTVEMMLEVGQIFKMVISDLKINEVVPIIVADLGIRNTHVGYGSGTVTPNNSDTTLQTETFRNAKLSTVTNVGEVRIISRLATSENNVSNAEIGTFDAVTNGNMAMRNLLNEFIKDTTMNVNYFIIGQVNVRQE